jgi:alkylmercury lyase
MQIGVLARRDFFLQPKPRTIIPSQGRGYTKMTDIKAQGTTAVPSLDQYWERLAPEILPFSPEEQRAAVTLYRELAKGQAVDALQLAQALGVSAAEGRDLLARDSIKAFTYADDQGRVLGFGGLAVPQMQHRFEVEGRTLWTWCAWDSLFIPEILGKTARVASPDPESGEIARLVVSPEKIESAEPKDAVVSFLVPSANGFQKSATNVMANFCHFVFFFTSRASGERWTAKHPGTFLYPLGEAFELAKRLNAKNFGAELARRASSAAATRPRSGCCSL